MKFTITVSNKHIKMYNGEKIVIFSIYVDMNYANVVLAVLKLTA